MAVEASMLLVSLYNCGILCKTRRIYYEDFQCHNIFSTFDKNHIVVRGDKYHIMELEMYEIIAFFVLFY